MQNQKLLIIVGVLVTVLYFAGSSVISAMYTIQSGTVGVLVTFGKFSEDIKQPGLHFKFPFIQNVNIFDIKMQTANYLGRESAQEDDGVMNRRQIEVLDSKSLPIGIEMSVQYTPKMEKAGFILERYGRNYFEKLINPVVRNIVRDVIGKYQAEDIAVKRSEIGNELRLQVTKEFEQLPFVLNNLGLRNINLPPVVLKKIEEVQLAKQEEQRLTMIEQQAKKNQEIKTIEANTRLIEVTTQAKADADKKRIEADARAYQISAEADATAKANQLIAASITPELINYRSIDKWNGQYPQMLINGGEQSNGLILSLPEINTVPLPPPTVEETLPPVTIQ
jgi:regulator of protease activity HflC (stomatin/prohibitin superfamily)